MTVNQRVTEPDYEQIVGAQRMVATHLGRFDPDKHLVYVLHSKQCLESSRDLEQCWYTLAERAGVDPGVWAGAENVPVLLGITRTHGLVPLARVHR